MAVLEALERIFLYIMIYSVVGWIYETIICSLEARRFVNRGFFNGPYCPIYGVGAMLDIAVVGRIENVALLFLFGALLDTVLEYITSYVMEIMFHARWWDYSTYHFNINGRVCLLGAVVFGLFSTAMVKVIHPAVVSAVGLVTQPWLHIVSGALFLSFTIDAIVTITGMAGFNEKLRQLTGELEAVIHAESMKLLGENAKRKLETVSEARERVIEAIRSSAAFGAVSSVYESFVSKFNAQQQRMIRAFPKLRSIPYEKTLSGLRRFILKHHKNDK